MGTNALSGGAGIIQDFRDTVEATGPDNYQFIGDTELREADFYAIHKLGWNSESPWRAEQQSLPCERKIYSSIWEILVF